MKRIYSLLPQQLAQRLRSIIEFDGGITDTHVLRANASADGGYGPRYRLPPGSQPQPRIPQGPEERTYDIKYYPRDVRRSADPLTAGIEASFGPAQRALLADTPLIEKPVEPSPGVKNPDVERYDRTGLRAAMTATPAATRAELWKHRDTHQPLPVWTRTPETRQWVAARNDAGLPPAAGAPTLKRISPWQYTQATEW